ncbi:MAG: hypothetical protein ACYTBJ_02280 [Planctomycetota bacterium]
MRRGEVYVRWHAISEAIRENCPCGGSGPGEGCHVCDVYHQLKEKTMRVVMLDNRDLGMEPLPDPQLELLR